MYIPGHKLSGDFIYLSYQMISRWGMMKRLIGLLLATVLLCGCSSNDALMDRALLLRGKLQQAEVSFLVQTVADYGDKTYTFSMECQCDAMGNLNFKVTEPQTIARITGKIAKGTGKLTFDDKILAFDILADGLISPVSGPWVMMETLRSGYLTSCVQESDGIRVSIDDSYAEKALHLDIWLDGQDMPKYCEVYWNGRRLLSMTVSSFTFV